MSYKSRLLVTMVVGLFLTACASKNGGQVVDKSTTSSANTSAGSTTTIDPSLSNAFGTGLSLQELQNLGITGDPLNYKVVYFQYNSSAIDQRSRVIAEAHGRYLQLPMSEALVITI